jgi:hypothetical protein
MLLRRTWPKRSKRSNKAKIRRRRNINMGEEAEVEVFLLMLNFPSNQSKSNYLHTSKNSII